MKQSILLGLVAVWATAGLAAEPAPQAGPTRPNIVYFLVDDLGYADVGFMGSRDMRTPNIDRLAKAGAVLTSFYVQPVCSPTRAALLTGRYATHTGVYTIVRPGAPWGLPLAERTLPQALREAGYTTAICGKWHLGEFQPEYLPTRRGFDHQYGHMFGALDYFTHVRDGKPDWYRDDQPLQEEGYTTHLIAREACRLIRAQPADKPLFLYVPFNGVHAPYQVPPEYKKAFPNLRGNRQAMAAMLAVVDEAVGQITTALDEKGMRRNTLILFSSDNGGPAPGQVSRNTPLRAGKGTIYEGGVRACAFATWPGHIPADTAISEPMHAVDWYPTLLKLAGASLEQTLAPDGLDVWPMLTQGAKSPHDAILLAGNSPSKAALRMGDWKLLLNASEQNADETLPGDRGAAKIELYDLAQDIGESKNLAAAQPEKVTQMRTRLDAFLKNAAPPGQDAAATNPPAQRAAAPPAPERPNILWLIAEDLGPHLGCYGTKEVWTPNLDRLAAEGVRYTRFYNGHVCSPSRSAFNTGMYATTIGAHNHRTINKKPLPEGVKVLSDWMRAAGYFTANVRELPAPCDFKGTGKTDWNFLYEGQPFDSARWSDLKTHQPFYAQVNFSETHRAFTAPKKADPNKVEVPPYYPDHPVTREDWGKYLDEATELDRKVGLVLAALEKDGLADNTVVVFFGDNGQAHVRGKQFCYEEGLLVPLLIRWPRSFPAPAHFQAGTVDKRLLHGIDLAPTMLAIAGAPKPPKMQGQIFLGARCEPDRQYVFGYRDRCDMTVMRLRTVRDDRYRYIHNFTPWVPFLAYNEYKQKQYPVWNLLAELHAQSKLTPPQEFLCQPTMPEEELYDLDIDPWEINNLATSDKPEHQAELKKLRSVLDKWIEDTGDQGRRPETLEELKASERRFVPERDWRPAPGTREALEADEMRARAAQNPPAPKEEPKNKKRRKR